MKKKLLTLIFIISFISNSIFSSTLYSRGSTGFFSAGTWSTVGHAGASCGCTPNTGDNVIIGTGHTVTLPVGTITVGPGSNCASITVRNGGTLNMLNSGVLDVKNGGILIIETGGSVKCNVFINRNNSDGVTIDGGLTLGGTNPSFSNGNGADIVGVGTITLGPGGTSVNNGTIFGSTGALPIELLSFEAKPNGNEIELHWSTATESNNDFFTVEKTKNGLDFETASICNGAGNSTSLINYTAVDKQPYDGVSYYRLKQTDYNGKYSYFPLVEIDFKSHNEFSFDVYPNPSSGDDLLNLAITSDQGEEILVVVYDITGKEYYSKIIVTENKGNSVYAVDQSQKLSPGIYLISASSKQQIYSKRLIIK